MNASIRAATSVRLLRRSCESLLGICGGLVADGELNDVEIRFLRTWLSEHAELSASWPGELILRRIEGVLSDGVITADERAHLLETLQQAAGGSFIETGAASTESTTLPLDLDIRVQIAGKAFCFTGKFLYGTRSSCERAVVDRGGTIQGVKRDLSFLVIGEMSSRDWKYSSFGNKIEEAIALKARGLPLAIVSEEQWVGSL